MINVGELRDKIVIQKPEYSRDENGFATGVLTDLYTLRAKRKTVSTKEFPDSDKENTEITYKFIFRKRAIDNSMVLKHKEKLFNIKHVHEFDDGMFIEITAVENK